VKIAIIPGTRPDITRMSPVMRECERRGADVVVILTGHGEYFSLDAGVLKGLMGQERPVVVDERNVVDADGFIGEGFVYKGIGRGDKNDHMFY